MNKAVLIGRWTRDPEVRYNGELAIARGSLAVDRKYTKKDSDQTADFISVKAFGKTAQFIEKYFRKGMKIAVTGRIETGSYEKDGRKVYTTDVVIEEAEFAESKSSEVVQTGKIDDDGFVEAPADIPEIFNY